MSEALTQKSSSNVREDIQGLRALAVLLVIFFHLGIPVPGGFIGVDVFFVISGFVITAMLEREWLKHNRISIRRFFVRRFWRLTPSLATVVAVTTVVGASILSAYGPQRLMVLTGIGAMFLSANAVIAKFTGGYFDLAADSNPLLNTWSLSVEEQFYIGFLIVLVFGWSLGKIVKRPYVPVRVVVASIFIVSFALAMLAQPGNSLEKSNWFFHFYSPLNRAWEFAAGSLLALFSNQIERVPNVLKKLSGIFGLLVVLFSAFYISQAQAWPSTFTVLPVFGSVLLIASSPAPGSTIYKILANKWAIYIGDRSYSLYLWHWPVIVILGYFALNDYLSTALALVISAVLTVVTYRWIETPLRHRRPNKKVVASILALGIFATPVVLSLTVHVANKKYFWNDSLKRQKIAVGAKHIADQDGCNKLISFLHRSFENCSWNTNLDGQPIYLLGDSNASQYSDGFIAAAKITGHPLIAVIGPGCPFLLEPFKQPDRNVFLDGNYSECSKFAQENYSWLKSQPRGLVVISNTDLYAKVSGLRVAGVDDSNTNSVNKYFEFLETSATKLIGDGFKVAIISGPIHFDPRMENFPTQYAWEPSLCTLHSELTSRCSVSMPIDEVKAFQGTYWRSLKEVAVSSGASLVDLGLVFCDSTSCPTQANGLQIYQDGRHTTVDAGLSLVPRFVTEINKIFKEN